MSENTKQTILVNRNTGKICVVFTTDENQVIDIDVSIADARAIEEALASGRQSLEN